MVVHSIQCFRGGILTRRIAYSPRAGPPALRGEPPPSTESSWLSTWGTAKRVRVCEQTVRPRDNNGSVVTGRLSIILAAFGPGNTLLEKPTVDVNHSGRVEVLPPLLLLLVPYPGLPQSLRAALFCFVFFLSPGMPPSPSPRAPTPATRHPATRCHEIAAASLPRIHIVTVKRAQCGMWPAAILTTEV